MENVVLILIYCFFFNFVKSFHIFSQFYLTNWALITETFWDINFENKIMVNKLVQKTFFLFCALLHIFEQIWYTTYPQGNALLQR